MIGDSIVETPAGVPHVKAFSREQTGTSDPDPRTPSTVAQRVVAAGSRSFALRGSFPFVGGHDRDALLQAPGWRKPPGSRGTCRTPSADEPESSAALPTRPRRKAPAPALVPR